MHVILSIIFYVVIDCSVARDSISRNYLNLIKLPISLVVPKLFAKQVITFHEKCIIDSKKIEMEKMMFILDNVIMPTPIV